MLTESRKLRKIARNRRDNAKYDADHRALRKALDPLVQAGLATCVRCGAPIEPGPWHLGHSDIHPELHVGPEHVFCNSGAPHRNVTSRQW